MGDMPEAAIFRRFSFLNAQVLLYKQAELMCLENKLRRLQADDNEVPGSRSLYAKNWWYLSDSDDQEDGDSKQWKLVKKIERKLKDYSKLSDFNILLHALRSTPLRTVRYEGN